MSQQSKQMYVAYELYAGENSDLPPAWLSDSSGLSWDDLISGYMGRDMSDSLQQHAGPTRAMFENAGVNNQMLQCPGVDVDAIRASMTGNDNYNTRNYSAIGIIDEAFIPVSENFGPTGIGFSIKQGQADDPSGTYLQVDLDRPGSILGYRWISSRCPGKSFKWQSYSRPSWQSFEL